MAEHKTGLGLAAGKGGEADPSIVSDRCAQSRRTTAKSTIGRSASSPAMPPVRPPCRPPQRNKLAAHADEKARPAGHAPWTGAAAKSRDAPSTRARQRALGNGTLGRPGEQYAQSRWQTADTLRANLTNTPGARLARWADSAASKLSRQAVDCEGPIMDRECVFRKRIPKSTDPARPPAFYTSHPCPQ